MELAWPGPQDQKKFLASTLLGVDLPAPEHSLQS